MDRHSTPGVSAVTCGLSCSGALLFEEILIAAQEWLLMDFKFEPYIKYGCALPTPRVFAKECGIA